MNHGSEQRKMLQKIYLTLRALDVNEDVDEILGGKFDPLQDQRPLGRDDRHAAPLHRRGHGRPPGRRAGARRRLDRGERHALAVARGEPHAPGDALHDHPAVAGRAFKYRFKTALSPTAAAAGQKVGSFRLVDAVIEFDVESDTRAAGVTGRFAMMGMGQQMPMRRPPMGPSPMTAGRPSPMAQGGGQWATPTGMGGSAAAHGRTGWWRAAAASAMGTGWDAGHGAVDATASAADACRRRTRASNSPTSAVLDRLVRKDQTSEIRGLARGCNHRVAVGNGSAAERRASVRT